MYMYMYMYIYIYKIPDIEVLALEIHAIIFHIYKDTNASYSALFI